ncbi:vesicular inhibitory amino acid transporter-like [Phalaenopsis equestris]|uniref:vesicular inhibitory amino acid transporter-like n=1 Tax=Phalaenopsis equestris TaxID=78828 RepID=UPI0009E35484|nr:vesicular inhibitory amino acid transporter-like [Phalaenopsis equestris]
MKTGTNFFETLLNAINAISGYGYLAMPFALAQGGWLSLAALLTIAAICAYTALLLKRCMESNSLVKTYPDVGELAFGSKGRILMTLLMNIELYFTVIGMLIIEGDNIGRIFPFHIAGLNIKAKQAFVALVALILLPTTWPKNLRILSYLSLGSILVSFFVLSSVFWVGAVDGVGFNEKGEIFNFSGMPTTLSLFVFSYGGHTIMPTIFSSMENPANVTIIFAIAFTLCTIHYVLMGIIGYLMFGEETNSIITLNLPTNLVASKIATWTVIAVPVVKYALAIMPVINSLEELFKIEGRVNSILLRTSVVISTAVIAIAAPFFVYVISLTGSLITGAATIFLPCFCYLKIFSSAKQRGAETMVIFCIIVVGVIVSLSGTYVSIKNIVKDID